MAFAGLTLHRALPVAAHGPHHTSGSRWTPPDSRLDLGNGPRAAACAAFPVHAAAFPAQPISKSQAAPVASADSTAPALLFLSESQSPAHLTKAAPWLTCRAQRIANRTRCTVVTVGGGTSLIVVTPEKPTNKPRSDFSAPSPRDFHRRGLSKFAWIGFSNIARSGSE